MFPNCQESNQPKSSTKWFSSDIEFRWERERNKKDREGKRGEEWDRDKEYRDGEITETMHSTSITSIPACLKYLYL